MSEPSQGKVVGKLPPSGSLNTTWDSSVHLAQQHPNEAVEVATDINVVTINSVRQYVKRAPYTTPDGHIEVSCRGSVQKDDGKRYGNMYFTWIPTTKRKK
jgi:hypothetical protein